MATAAYTIYKTTYVSTTSHTQMAPFKQIFHFAYMYTCSD